ncbi:MAG: hypothetical protein Q7R97_01030 [Candidatus Daviesbacteria bacterium]|nr:hypothetical protein [Candidatus Daviesbacteria bacterium]
MITDNDIIKLKKSFATKDDLEKTNKKLGKLEGVVNNLVVEVVGIKSEIVQIRETMITKDDHRQLMTVLDSLAGDVKTVREEQIMHSQTHEDNRLEHKEFKERFSRIESVPVIALQIKRR